MRWSGIAGLIVWTALAVTASAASPVASTPPAFSGQQPLVTGESPADVAIADVNGDRKPDLLTANSRAKSFSVLLNDGRGHFQPHRDYQSTRGPLSLAVADVDGDGKRDVLTAERGGGYCGTVSEFLNGGRAEFRLVQTYGSCTEGAVSTGDFNGDGKVDFATARAGDCCLVGTYLSSVFLNDGSGTFTLAGRCLSGAGYANAIGDVNGDDKQDLVVANWDHVTVIINDGNFADCGAPAGTYAMPPGTTSLALADLNGDGKLDVATTSYRLSTVSVLLNEGAGHFADRVDSPAGDTPISLAVGDLNGDHRPDLVTNSDAGIVSVLVGGGDGTFWVKRDFKTNGSETRAVAVGDLNGDGQPDVAATNIDTDTVSVFFNRTTVCRVPNVKGKTLADARRALTRAHCHAGTIRNARSKAAAKGRVVSQRPAPGAVLQAGGTVHLSIGSSK